MEKVLVRPKVPLAQAMPTHFHLPTGLVYFSDRAPLPFSTLADIFSPDELLSFLEPLQWN